MNIEDFQRRIAGLSPEKRALLEQRLLGAGAPGRAPGASSIPRRRAGEPCALSFAQQRLWFLQQLDPDSAAYNTPKAFRMTGVLDVEALQKTLDAIVERHEALRTNFVVRDGTPLQVVAPPRGVTLPLIDLAARSAPEREVELHRHIEEESRRVFDLSADLMLRAALVRFGPADHVLLLTLHHVASDGWSGGVFVREMAAFYEAFATGSSPSLAALPIQYADYAVWQRDWLQGDVLETQLAYWRRCLEGAPSALDLPADRARPAVQTYRGARETTLVPAVVAERLMALGRAEGVTPFMALLAAFQTLLSRYTGGDDIVVGSPTAGRNRLETEGLIGFFVNTLVLRTDLSGDPTFTELLRRTRHVALSAYAHQDVPFEKLVEELRPERDTSRSPIFQVLFGFQSTPRVPLTLPGLSVTSLDVEPGTAKFDLSLYVDTTPDGLEATLEYSTDLFDASTVSRMLGHFRTLLEGIAADPGRRLSELPLLTDGERRQLLVEWNDTAAEYPRDACIHQLFEAQARRTPDAVAVVSGESSLTYAELEERAKAVARRLRALGVGPEALVGLCVERSVEMVTALLGILGAGGAYLPLDPTYPRERLAFILEDARPAVLLTQQRLLGHLPETGARIVCLDTDWAAIAADGAHAPAGEVRSEHLAYVIYTSGSTGWPKGVQVQHRAVVNLLTAMREKSGITAADRLLAVTTLSFDIAGLELFLPLTTGACVVIASRDVAADGVLLRELLMTAGATMMQATPATWRVLLDAGWSGTKPLKILCGGEALSRDLADRLRGRCSTLWNLYGPTETTIWSAVDVVDAGDGPVAIGRPIANTRMYLLDRGRQPVPIGVTGELYIGGDGVARGYLGRPELTAERFPPDSFGGEAGTRLYRTGDLARYRPDGRLEYRGRLDDQVKVRGFRIELGEVESVLSRHPGVKETAVVAREDRSGEQRLMAYVVPGPDGPVTTVELREFLGVHLPGYMVPSQFVTIDRLPLTPNGKVDRRALPVGERAGDDGPSGAPADPIERQLADIWAQVLGVPSVGVRDNFFDLGGHSLLGVRLFVEIESAFGRRLPLATLFTAPTIAELAARLRPRAADVPWSPLVAIQPHGAPPPLFCAHPVASNVLVYRDLARRLAPDQPVYGLQPKGLDGSTPYTRIEDMAALYVGALRTVQPRGPYRVAGASFGGVVAFEIAQQLVAQGEHVSLLGLIDTPRPGWSRYAPTLPRWRRRLYVEMYRITQHARNLRVSSPRDRRRYLLETGRAALLRAGRRLGIRPAGVPPEHVAAIVGLNGALRDLEAHEQIQVLLRVFRANRAALRAYVPRVYPGRLTLFRARRQGFGTQRDPTLGWAPLVAGGIDIREIPGDHGSCCREPDVEGLVEQLRQCLRMEDPPR